MVMIDRYREAVWRKIAERIEARVQALPPLADARDELVGMYRLAAVLLRAIRLAEADLGIDDQKHEHERTESEEGTK